MLNKRLSYIYVLVITILLFSSCSITEKAMRTTTFMPDNVELRLSLNDFEYIGESEVSISYNKYIGFITILHEVNEKEASKTVINSISTYGRSWLPIERKLKRALYEAQIEIPEAEFFIPINIITEKQTMFLGSKIKKTLRVKAYKIRETNSQSKTINEIKDID